MQKPTLFDYSQPDNLNVILSGFNRSMFPGFKVEPANHRDEKSCRIPRQRWLAKLTVPRSRIKWLRSIDYSAWILVSCSGEGSFIVVLEVMGSSEVDLFGGRHFSVGPTFVKRSMAGSPLDMPI
jgi:hypothetical protein